VEQLADVAGSFADADAHRLLIAQPVAGANRIRLVERGTVVVTQRSGDTALRVAGVALGRFRLRQHDDAAGAGERNRRAQSSDAAADDHEVERAARMHRGAILSNAFSWPSPPCP